MSTDEKALAVVQEKMVGEISPFLIKSQDLKARAEAQTVTNEREAAAAVALKKEITGHRKLVQDTRLDITRQFDEVKKAIMTKEAEILLPLDEGQTDLGQKILTYQEEQERIAREERERVEKIVLRVTLSVSDTYRFKTVDEVQDEGERFKKLYGELKTEDQKLPDVKAAFTVSINRLQDRKAYLIEQEEQRIEREKLEAQRKEQSEAQAKIDAEKAANERKARQIEAEKERLEREKQRKADEEEAEAARKKRESEEKNRVKTGARTVTKFEITDPLIVPREYCEPVEKLIRAAIAEGKTVEGVRVWTEKKV
ncbi:hypothetical protein HZA56_14160 [Candidatus Poribacteria bacterium]|nr:hypothetical protein [Candidatus Poribacteria bacterium]